MPGATGIHVERWNRGRRRHRYLLGGATVPTNLAHVASLVYVAHQRHGNDELAAEVMRRFGLTWKGRRSTFDGWSGQPMSRGFCSRDGRRRRRRATWMTEAVSPRPDLR